QRLLTCLHELTAADRERKRYDRAIAWAQRATGLDGGDEESHRQLMLLYALQGEQAKSLQQYHDCTRYLREELGVAPDPDAGHPSHWRWERARGGRRRGREPGAPPLQRPLRRLAPAPEMGREAVGGRPPFPRPSARAEGLVLSAELTGPLVGR